MTEEEWTANVRTILAIEGRGYTLIAPHIIQPTPEQIAERRHGKAQRWINSMARWAKDMKRNTPGVE